MKKSFLGAALLAGIVLLPMQCFAKGEITPNVLQQIQKSYNNKGGDKALRNAVSNVDINTIAKSADSKRPIDEHFSVKVDSKGITDQKSSGRCWLFTGLNVMRAKAIAKYKLNGLEFSQNYCFFYDQLEKSNLFLENVIANASKPINDTSVQWQFQNPISDGGTFTGVADLVLKYGLVPKSAMPETYSSEHTSRMATLLKTKLRQGGIRLRQLIAKGAKSADVEKAKVAVLGDVYRILSISLGVPPTEFDYTRCDAKGNIAEVEHHTPMSFFKKYGDENLLTNYVMLMNDPSRDYYKVYEIDLDRHVQEGKNWLYINLPVEDIKKMAIESLQDSTRMYFSCDVGKQLDRERGLCDLNNYDYDSLMGVDFSMDKKERIQSYASGSSHAMTLMAVDLDAKGVPTKWKVENSWGAKSGFAGHIIMTDEWFNEYMFRLVVEKKYVPNNILKLLEQKPIKLPAWDPMFLPEE